MDFPAFKAPVEKRARKCVQVLIQVHSSLNSINNATPDSDLAFTRVLLANLEEPARGVQTWVSVNVRHIFLSVQK